LDSHIRWYTRDPRRKEWGKENGMFEDKLRHKDNVIAELAQELLELKKKYPGLK